MNDDIHKAIDAIALVALAATVVAFAAKLFIG